MDGLTIVVLSGAQGSNSMKTVNTYRQEDFDILVKAGMSPKNKPVTIKDERFKRAVRFNITDEVYAKLDLDNRYDCTIQTVLNLDDFAGKL